MARYNTIMLSISYFLSLLPIAYGLPIPSSYEEVPEAIPGSVDDPGTKPSGSSGDSHSSVHLSSRSQIAIIVVAVLVAIIGGELFFHIMLSRGFLEIAAKANHTCHNIVVTAVLFYLTKKRQWELRAAIRRSARRLTAPLKSPGLLSPRFNRGPSSQTRSAKPGATPPRSREVRTPEKSQQEKQKQQQPRVKEVERNGGFKAPTTTPEGPLSGWKRFITMKEMEKK